MCHIFAIVTLCAKLCCVELCYNNTPLIKKISQPMHFVMAMLIVKPSTAVAVPIEPYGMELAKKDDYILHNNKTHILLTN